MEKHKKKQREREIKGNLQPIKQSGHDIFRIDCFKKTTKIATDANHGMFRTIRIKQLWIVVENIEKNIQLSYEKKT